ncbi:hypothetical protein GE09DRAFT_1244234 [Coniochaeta sp. 2T2.1]|nr:hypothetical protein GE09DRAFT_1244234 [Coniochaeta sp. 2T2.1]
MSGYVNQAQGRPAYGNYGVAALAAQSSAYQPAGYAQGQTPTSGYGSQSYGHLDHGAAQQSAALVTSGNPPGQTTTSGGQTSSGALSRVSPGFLEEIDGFNAEHQEVDTPEFDPTIHGGGYSDAEYATSAHLQQPEGTGAQHSEASSQHGGSKTKSKDKGKGKRQHASTLSTGSTSSHHRRGQPSKRSRGEQRATDAAEYASGANTSGPGYEEQEQQQGFAPRSSQSHESPS